MYQDDSASGTLSSILYLYEVCTSLSSPAALGRLLSGGIVTSPFAAHFLCRGLYRMNRDAPAFAPNYVPHTLTTMTCFLHQRRRIGHGVNHVPAFCHF